MERMAGQGRQDDGAAPSGCAVVKVACWQDIPRQIRGPVRWFAAKGLLRLHRRHTPCPARGLPEHASVLLPLSRE